MRKAKYAMTYMDGMTPIGAWQGRNFNMDTMEFDGPDVYHVDTLGQAEYIFAGIVGDTGQQDATAQIYRVDGGPLVPDMEYPILELSVGPRGGLKKERL